MNVEPLFIAITFVLSMLTAWTLVAPFFFSDEASSTNRVRMTALQRLQEEKELLYRELEELEFDYRSGRTGEPEYDALKADIVRALTDCLEKLETSGEKEDEPSRS